MEEVHVLFLLVVSCLAGGAESESAEMPVPTAWVEVCRRYAIEARQAAAADDRYFYAIVNRFIGKYDRFSGKRLAVSHGAAEHLNSGFLWDGQIYCAHSNYPEKPEQSEIKVLNPKTMVLATFKDFGESEGSLTWVLRRDGDWWCHFAYYGDDNAKSYLARFDDEWQETGRWTFPSSVIAKFGRHSASGGVWFGDLLLVTGHDAPEVYVLRLPAEEGELIDVGTASVPFTGQGIALDPLTNGLIGINRPKGRIILAQPAPCDRAQSVNRVTEMQ